MRRNVVRLNDIGNIQDFLMDTFTVNQKNVSFVLPKIQRSLSKVNGFFEKGKSGLAIAPLGRVQASLPYNGYLFRLSVIPSFNGVEIYAGSNCFMLLVCTIPTTLDRRKHFLVLVLTGTQCP